MPTGVPLTARNLQFCFLNDLDNTPAFAGGQRSRLDDTYFVADLSAELVVSHKFLTLADVFAVHRMLDQTVDTDDDGLGHFVRGDHADLLSTLTAVDLFVRIAACNKADDVCGPFANRIDDCLSGRRYCVDDCIDY